MQITLTAGVLIGGMFLGIKGFAGKIFGVKEHHDKDPRHMILEAASLTDMAPIRDIASALVRIAVATEKQAEVQRDRLETEQRKLEIAAAIEEAERKRGRRSPT